MADTKPAAKKDEPPAKPADDPKPAPAPEPKPAPKPQRKRQGDLPGNSDPRERHMEPAADEHYG
jgi:hypothetical protein